ncbi:MAG TPA: SepM family pheromone-processing serine protease [Lactobacillaceae bacterium]|jgi:PDZ domain-containing protein
MKNKKQIIGFGAIFLIIAAAVTLLWPVNGYVESPGRADNLANFVKIDGHQDNGKGAYRITSVYLSKANVFGYLKTKIDPHTAFETTADITGDQDDATYAKIQNFYMQSAIANAEQVAYSKANQHVKLDYRGIYVLSVSDKSTFKNKIEVGDTITKVDGHHFDNSTGYINYLADKKTGTAITLTYQRDGKTATAKGKTIKLPNTADKQYPKGRYGVGVTLTDDVQVTTKPKITVDPGQIGGPSGGLMFSLQMYDQLTGKNIRAGRNISGTGTIDAKGNVGEIGGIDKKIIAAKKAGSTVFFAPYLEPTKELLKYEENHQTNYQMAVATAKKYAPSVKVIPVRTFQDALNYLENGTIIDTK